MKNVNMLSANEVNTEVMKHLEGKKSYYGIDDLMRMANKYAHTSCKKSISTTKNQKKKVTY